GTHCPHCRRRPRQDRQKARISRAESWYCRGHRCRHSLSIELRRRISWVETKTPACAGDLRFVYTRQRLQAVLASASAGSMLTYCFWAVPFFWKRTWPDTRANKV